MSRRGLVISNPMAVTNNGLHIKNTNLDRQELRANLLFWDALDFPRIIYLESVLMTTQHFSSQRV